MLCSGSADTPNAHRHEIRGLDPDKVMAHTKMSSAVQVTLLNDRARRYCLNEIQQSGVAKEAEHEVTSTFITACTLHSTVTCPFVLSFYSFIGERTGCNVVEKFANAREHDRGSHVQSFAR